MTCLGQYESIDAYANVDDIGLPADVSISNSSSSSPSVTMTPDSDAAELVYFACMSYRKRKSGEVDLKHGVTVTVLQRELTGNQYMYWHHTRHLKCSALRKNDFIARFMTNFTRSWLFFGPHHSCSKNCYAFNEQQRCCR